MLIIKELSAEQIERANNNSLGGKRGDLCRSDYESDCEKVMSWGFTEYKTQQLLDKVYAYHAKDLSLSAQHVSVAVAGGSNYNAKRLDKSAAILSNAADYCDWLEDIEAQATRKKFDEIFNLTRSIMWGVRDGYNVNKEWKELAARSRKDFETLYEKLNAENEFKKSSTAYKLYHNLIYVMPIKQATLYSDGDFSVVEEDGKIYIDFRLKPQRPLIVAMKSRRFYWNNHRCVWSANATDDLREWVKTIRDRYEQYI